MFNLFRKKKEEPVLSNSTETQKVSVKYSYEWKEEVPLNERDCNNCNSEGFCQKLMDLNRLYTRADIEKMSVRLGYSVWDRRGGDDCKHYFKSNIVVQNANKN